MILLNKLGRMSDLRGLYGMSWAPTDGLPRTPVTFRNRVVIVTTAIESLKRFVKEIV